MNQPEHKTPLNCNKAQQRNGYEPLKLPTALITIFPIAFQQANP